jgi:beta-xylosidase
MRALAGLFLVAAAQLATPTQAALPFSNTGTNGNAQSQQAYLFTSFHGNGDGLRLSYSYDTLDWTELGRIYLTPVIGSKLLRDPHIIRGQDGLYHMVWTTGWNDTGFGHASSPDLVHWSEQNYLPVMEKIPGTKNCWAPETFYDRSHGQYILMWSSNVEKPGQPVPQGGYYRAYYALTKDFKTFTPPKLLFDPGFNNIDTTMLEQKGKFYIVLKETDGAPNKKWGDIRAAVANQPLGPYQLLPDPIFTNEQIEGPTIIQVGDKLRVFADYYGAHHYGLHESIDWRSWKDLTRDPQVSIVNGQRHGTVFPVPVALVHNLRSEFAAGAPKPILDGFTADPAIRVFGDTYYVYPTVDRPNWNTTEFAVWSSKNLINWKKAATILDLPKDISWAKIKAWAPDCVARNGKYYFYFCGDGKIGVATAPTPTGPFKDALNRPLLVPGGKVRTNTIDPYPFIDDNGQACIFFGNGSLCQVYKLKPDMITLDGDPQDIPLKEFREGIVVFKRAGKYYFMWSIDDARSPNYRIGYGIADSPFGPVKSPDHDFIVLQKNGSAIGTGHHSVVNVPGTDRWYVAYHRHAIPGGGGYKRETCLVRMEFNADGTIKPMDPMTFPFQPGDKGEPVTKPKLSK